ncbi:MAG: hypothetical protein WC858_04730 [Parcubacteria group bacterium]|jgi:hypothetical protein
MIQKTVWNKKNIGITISLFAFFALLSGASPVFSQELAPANGGIVTDIAAGTPVEEIISAVSSGGLSASGDTRELQPDVDEQSPEISVSSERGLPNPNPPAGFNPEAIQSLEQAGGLSSSPQVDSDAPTVFKLAVKFFERVVFKKDVEFLSRPKFDEGLDISGTPTFDKDTAGYAIIKKGNQSVAVEFDKKYSSPPIITASLSLQQYENSEVRAAAEDLLLISDVKYIVTNVSEKGFEIMIDQEAYSDIPFSWHALAVDNPKTYKKKGGSPDSKNAANPASSISAQSGSSSKPSADAGPAAVGQSEASSSAEGAPGSGGDLQNQSAPNLSSGN